MTIWMTAVRIRGVGLSVDTVSSKREGVDFIYKTLEPHFDKDKFVGNLREVLEDQDTTDFEMSAGRYQYRLVQKTI